MKRSVYTRFHFTQCWVQTDLTVLLYLNIVLFSLTQKAKEATEHLPHDKSDSDKEVIKQPTSPPESSFIKLAPSRNRYTILRDEL